MTETDRQREIARLEGKRDRMLDRVVPAVAFRHHFVPAVFLLLVVFLGVAVTLHPGPWRPLGLVLYAVLVFGVGRLVWSGWLHPFPRVDRMALSDTLGYDGERPRDIQRRIDALRARSPVDRR